MPHLTDKNTECLAQGPTWVNDRTEIRILQALGGLTTQFTMMLRG